MIQAIALPTEILVMAINRSLNPEADIRLKRVDAHGHPAAGMKVEPRGAFCA